ncbi:unnamed protein product [Jaminaea pallidilutea]
MAGDETGKGSFKHIGNKAKRQEEYRKYRSDKRKDKLAKRVARAKEERGPGGEEKKQARLAANKTRTIENTRSYNPTIISEPNTHEGLKPAPGLSQPQSQQAESSKAAAARAQADLDVGDGPAADTQEDNEDAGSEVDEDAANVGDEEDADQQAFEDASAPPAILITTSSPSSSTSPHLASLNGRSHPAERTRDFIDELLNMFPGGEYRPRAKAKGASLGKIAGWARKRGYNAMVVVGEDHKEPTMLTLIGLPNGPSAIFRLTSVRMGKDIHGHARSTPHSPELILNNFTTALGHSVGSLLQSLFPAIPQLEGRQVLTAHNQRDFIFFRRHRYEFSMRKGEEIARLQEIGPKFTVKLRKLMSGLPKGAGGWDGVIDFDGDGGQVMNMGGDEGAAPDKDRVQDRADTKRRRGEVDEPTTEFEWKPKMSVSRRNFYL